VQDAGRFVARGDTEQVTERQYAIAYVQLDRVAHWEMWQLVGIDLQHSNLVSRIGADQLPLVLSAIIQGDRDVVGVQDIAPNGQYVAR